MWLLGSYLGTTRPWWNDRVPLGRKPDRPGKNHKRIDFPEKRRPHSRHPPKSITRHERSTLHSIHHDSFRHGGPDAGQRIDLRCRRDVEIELAADIPWMIQQATRRPRTRRSLLRAD